MPARHLASAYIERGKECRQAHNHRRLKRHSGDCGQEKAEHERHTHTRKQEHVKPARIGSTQSHVDTHAHKSTLACDACTKETTRPRHTTATGGPTARLYLPGQLTDTASAWWW